MNEFHGGIPTARFTINQRAITITKMGTLFRKQVTIIPMRNVASWERPALRNEVRVRTNDGKTHTLIDLHPDTVLAALEEAMG
jgi:hypothetical protein